jgi:hypothetical protein
MAANETRWRVGRSPAARSLAVVAVVASIVEGVVLSIVAVMLLSANLWRGGLSDCRLKSFCAVHQSVSAQAYRTALYVPVSGAQVKVKRAF